MKVLLTHVPYAVRGGEDVHVDSLARAYEALGAKVIRLPQPDARASFSEAVRSLTGGNRREWDRLWNSEKPDLIHLNNAFPTLGPGFFGWIRDRGIRAVMTIHNHRFYCTNGVALRDGQICKDCLDSPSVLRPILHNCNSDPLKTAYHALALKQMRRGDLYFSPIHALIAPSPYVQAELIRFGVSPNRIRQIVHPVEAPNDGAKSRIRWDVAYIGRLSPEKGTEALIRCIRAMPDLRFVVGGSGPEQKRMERLQSDCANLKYIGQLSREQVAATIQASKITMAPSLCHETLGLFALESFVQGRRCVVSHLESAKWLCQDGYGGVPARTDSAESVQASLRKALGMPALSEAEVSGIRGKLGFSRFSRELQILLRDVLS